VSYFGWKPYVPVAKRRAQADKAMKKLAQAGQAIEPVVISGRKIAHSFWGAAWCDHLEQLSDYANRLPRGRAYVRNGSVRHLGIAVGQIDALVSGTSLYRIKISIAPLPEAKWQQLRARCSGKIGSALELLQGKLSQEVMRVVTDSEQGLFPKPQEIQMQCSCPDWAGLCKHLAAVLYAVGARLDDRPELLFQLRSLDPQELISAELNLDLIGQGQHSGQPSGRPSGRRLADADLSALFGVEVDDSPLPRPPQVPVPTSASGAAVPAAQASKTTKTAKNPKTKAKRPPAGTEPNQKPVEFEATAAAVVQLRERLGMTPVQFARLLGISPASIYKWESQQGPLNLQRRSETVLRKAAAMTPAQAMAIGRIRG
jgi:uncharacterized Zn finger protein